METLKNLEIGKSAVISKVGGTGALRQHFLDMGMIPGVKVTMMKHAPMGGRRRALAVRACVDSGFRRAFYRTISAFCDNLVKKYRD